MAAAMEMTYTLPPELLAMVFSRFEKADLLNCRLVCKSWNSECLRIFRASDWKLKVNEDNIGEFVEFFQRSPTPECILPLKLFYWGFEFEDFEDDMEKPLPLKEGLTSLFAILGDTCIETFEVGEIYLSSYGSSVDEDHVIETGQKLMEILALVSKGLKELNLMELDVALSPEHALAVTTYLSSRIDLPNLKSFMSHSEGPGEAAKTPSLFNYLMEGCPNLKMLEMNFIQEDEAELDNWNIPLAQLEALEIPNFKPTLPFVQKIQLCKPPLKKLELYLRYLNHDSDSRVEADMDATLIVNIITSVSCTLEYLRLMVGSGTSLKIPVLKKLKHLHTNCIEPVFLSMGQIYFNSNSFPSLETLDISIDLDMWKPVFPSSRLPDFPNLKKFIIHLDDSVIWEWNSKPYIEKMKFPQDFFYSRQRTIFETITEVDLDLYSGGEEPSFVEEECIKDNLRVFNTLFPVLSKITIEYSGREGFYIVGLLQSLLHSLGDGNLKEITILNSTRNFLRKALKEMLYPQRIVLENLEYPGLVDHLAKAWTEYTNGFKNFRARPELELEFSRGCYKKGSIILQDEHERDYSLKVFSGVERIRMLPRKWGTCKKLESNLDFTLIARYFPNLRHLSIPADWFATDDETLCSEQIQNIRQLFPAGISIDREAS